MFIFLNSQKEYYKWTDDECKLKGVDFHQEGKSKKKKAAHTQAKMHTHTKKKKKIKKKNKT